MIFEETRGAGRLSSSRKKKAKKNIAINYVGMAVITCVALILLTGLAWKSVDLRQQIAVYDARAAELEESIEDEKDRTEEIDAQKEYMQTDEYAAEVARDKLGLVKSNEIVFEEK